MQAGLSETGVMRVLGAMSGTSLDGVDAAVLETDGHDICCFGPTAYRPYTPEEQSVLKAALGQWSGSAVEAAKEVVEHAHLDLFKQFEDIDLIGFHGQTLAHDPAGGRTLQVGDGAFLAREMGKAVAWDFRSEDVARGGEGAPLAPFYHFACTRHIGARAPMAWLNLGGVGNLTFVDPASEKPEEAGALLAFDTGPANAPINDVMLRRRGLPFDHDGKLAREGRVDQAVVEAFRSKPYVNRVPPKSLDRNDFADIVAKVNGLGDADAVATLVAVCVTAVVQGMQHCPHMPEQLLVTGGGRHNPVMMEMLQEALPCPVRSVEQVGLDGDMLEAQAFAYLAVRVTRGLPISAPGTTGVVKPVVGGILSGVSRNPAAR